jgi:hypothetical protein
MVLKRAENILLANFWEIQLILFSTYVENTKTTIINALFHPDFHICGNQAIAY